MNSNSEPGKNRGYLGERLFHFWKHDNRQLAFHVFTSIMERGLLLSCGDKEFIDRFTFSTSDGGTNSFDVLQESRVCFTDIPEKHLNSHAIRYGMCGLGFSRKTILNWGGLPAWYLPNHIQSGTLMEHGAAIIRCMNNADIAVAILKAMFDVWRAEKLEAYDGFKAVRLDPDAEPLSVWELDDLITSGKRGISHLKSFLKEMSSKNVDDYEYLYEREWRIVSGIRISNIEVFRPLTTQEKDELARARPDWALPVQPLNPLPRASYPSSSKLDNFHYFNGLSPNDQISKYIEVIFVPDEEFYELVAKYISDNPARFQAETPEVRIFDNDW